jgi:hypothetical protein
VFARIDPKQFEACFLHWIQSVSEEIKGVIAVDGKTLRRSHDRGKGKKALHLVSAWASENRLVLAQLATPTGCATRSLSSSNGSRQSLGEGPDSVLQRRPRS